MNAETEIALETYLTAQLSGITGIAVHAATKRATLPKDRRFVLAAVRECPRLKTSAVIYEAMFSVVVTTPILKNSTVAEHKELVKETLWALQPRVDADHDADAVTDAREALDTAIVAESGFHCHSTWAEGPKEEHTADDWQTILAGKLLLTVD